MKIFYRVYAWAVEFGKGYRALILDEPKAIDYAARSHGVVKALYERVEEPDAAPLDAKEVNDGPATA